MKTPTPLLELCEKATKGPREVFKGKSSGYTEVYINDADKGSDSFRPLVANGFKKEADAQLCARLSPETVRAVYEALQTAKTDIWQTARVSEGNLTGLDPTFPDDPPVKLGGPRIIHRAGVDESYRVHRAIEHALALLDGLTQVTFTTPPDSRTGFKSRSVV